MQSPLTPQRGRIESNPREYTHMGPRFCSELKAMLADRRPPAVLLPHKRGNPDARAWIIGHSPNKSGYSDDERGFSDTYRTRADIWTESAAKASKTVQISTLDIRPSENPRSYGDGYGKASSPDRQWLCRTTYSCAALCSSNKNSLRTSLMTFPGLTSAAPKTLRSASSLQYA